MTTLPDGPNADPTQLGKVLAQGVYDNKFLAMYTEIGFYPSLTQFQPNRLVSGPGGESGDSVPERDFPEI